MLPVTNKAARDLTGALRRKEATAAPVPVPSQERPAATRVAEQLQEACGDDVVMLHHRRTPRVKPHIDHLVMTRTGVWIVHSRRNQGRVATRKPMFGEPKLTIGGRERTDLLTNLSRQVGYVEAVLEAAHPDVQVRSALCFVDTEAPLLRTLYLGSYLFFGAQAVAKHLNSDGPCDPARAREVAAILESSFPAA